MCQNTCAVPPPSNEIDRELLHLEAELKRLEAEYNMYFAGRLPRPPWETRKQVDNLVKRLDRAHISNYGDRFRFSTLQARYAIHHSTLEIEQGTIDHYCPVGSVGPSIDLH